MAHRVTGDVVRRLALFGVFSRGGPREGSWQRLRPILGPARGPPGMLLGSLRVSCVRSPWPMRASVLCSVRANSRCASQGAATLLRRQRSAPPNLFRRTGDSARRQSRTRKIVAGAFPASAGWLRPADVVPCGSPVAVSSSLSLSARFGPSRGRPMSAPLVLRPSVVSLSTPLCSCVSTLHVTSVARRGHLPPTARPSNSLSCTTQDYALLRESPEKNRETGATQGNRGVSLFAPASA